MTAITDEKGTKFAIVDGNQTSTLAELGHTKDHRNCPVCDAARDERLDPAIPPETLMPEAGRLWLDTRRFVHQGVDSKRSNYIAPRTITDYEDYIDCLGKFFGQLQLREIHLGHIRAYQSDRSKTCGAAKINQETGILRTIMRRSGAWTDALEEGYEALRVDAADIPRAMTPRQQENYLQVAASREEWNVVYWYSLISLHTTCSNCEMRGIKIGDVNMFDGILMIRKGYAKNRHRVRTIPLTADAKWAVQMALVRARSLGAAAPDHYLFPFREKRGAWNPCRPMTNSGIKKPFDAVRKAAEVPWLRQHDLRHSAITRMAEAGTPIPVIMSMAGHITQRMLQHYTQVSEQAKRQALEAVYGSGGKRSAPAPTRRAGSLAFMPAWKQG